MTRSIRPMPECFVNINGYENDPRCADWRHPVDFIEPLENQDSPREAADGLVSALIWAAEGAGLHEKGLRVVTILRSLRPEFFPKKEFELLAGAKVGDKVRNESLAQDFRSVYDEKSQQDVEALVPLLVWAAQGEFLDDKGFRLILMLRVLHAGLFAGITFEEIASLKGFSKQRAESLEKEFRTLFFGK